MGHSAIPILMAVLSYCVWGNVEVRATQPGSFVTMAHCNFCCMFSSMSTGLCCILLHVDITLGTHTAASMPCLHNAVTNLYLGQV